MLYSQQNQADVSNMLQCFKTPLNRSLQTCCGKREEGGVKSPFAALLMML